MDLTPLTSVTNAAVGAGGQTLGKQQFLELLVAQLAHQDPLNPLEDKEFIAQLAQFSSLEQAMATNDQLTGLQLAQTAMVNAQMSDLIGREITATSEVLVIGDGVPPPLCFRLDAAAAQTTVRVLDSNGRTVRTLTLGERSAGAQSVAWDGRDDSGQALAAGTYRLQVVAEDAAGRPVSATTQLSGVVTGVTFSNGYPELLLGTLSVLPADVISIQPAPEATP